MKRRKFAKNRNGVHTFMGTFDSLIGRAKSVVDDLGKKTNDVVEISKMKLTVASLGSDIDKVYQKLGLMVYEMAKSGSENRGLIDGCVAEIDALKQKLDEVTGQMDQLKNVRRCDSCGNAVDITAQFCPMCGSLLHTPAPEIVVNPVEPEPAQGNPEDSEPKE